MASFTVHKESRIVPDVPNATSSNCTNSNYSPVIHKGKCYSPETEAAGGPGRPWPTDPHKRNEDVNYSVVKVGPNPNINTGKKRVRIPVTKLVSARDTSTRDVFAVYVYFNPNVNHVNRETIVGTAHYPKNSNGKYHTGR